MSYDFRYIRTGTGELSGPSMVRQTELALSEIGTTAETAQSTADSATTLATTALTTANSAESAAGTAQSTADEALAAAEAAQSAADAAQAAADAAQADADTLADTKADVYHASTSTEYGLGSDELYGHVQLSDSVSDSTLTVDSGTAATPAAVAAVYAIAQAAAEAAGTAQSDSESRAPVYHASEETTYGLGDSSLYGHLKLSDAIDGEEDADDGTAATPYAVSLVNTKAAAAVTTAATASTTANTALTQANYAISLITTLEESSLFTEDDETTDLDSVNSLTRLYLTGDVSITTSMGNTISAPFWFWTAMTEDGDHIIQFVYADGVIYSREGTVTETETEDDNGDTVTESSTEWTDWAAPGVEADDYVSTFETALG